MLPARKPSGRLPNFLIIGANRTGTTSLALSLKAHPQVFVPPEKALHFFDDSKQFARGMDWYRAQFRDAQDELAVGEASPTYMHSTFGAQRIAAALPGARLIVLLRNPVDRAYSDFLHCRTWAGETRSFAQAIRDEMSGEGSGRYVPWGRYAEQLQPFATNSSNQPLLVVFFEDLRAFPESTYASACRFLSVDPTFSPPHLGDVYNSHFKVASVRLRMAMQRWRYRPGLAGTVARGINRLNVRLQRSPYPPMDQALREELIQYYRQPNATLGEMLGVDLSKWWSEEAEDAEQRLLEWAKQIGPEGMGLEERT